MKKTAIEIFVVTPLLEVKQVVATDPLFVNLCCSSASADLLEEEMSLSHDLRELWTMVPSSVLHVLMT